MPGTMSFDEAAVVVAIASDDHSLIAISEDE